MDKQIIAGLILNAYYAQLTYLESKGKKPIQVKEEMEKFQNAVLDQVLSNWEYILKLLNEKYPDKYPPKL